jgi:hypothetical protein
MAEGSSSPTPKEVEELKDSLSDKAVFALIHYLATKSKYNKIRISKSIVWKEYYEWRVIFGYPFSDAIQGAIDCLKDPHEEPDIIVTHINQDELIDPYKELDDTIKHAIELLEQIQEISSDPNRLSSILLEVKRSVLYIFSDL